MTPRASPQTLPAHLRIDGSIPLREKANRPSGQKVQTMSKNEGRRGRINRWRVIDNAVHNGWGATLRLALLLLLIYPVATILIGSLLR